MSKLVKIREISLKYDISARALKYYEDMGLIQSTKSDDYAYRLYDEAAIKRLEQILILRKLNIKIKDIQRIFNSNSSEVVLEVLSQKVTDIDDEVVLLHELKEIILEFINQIEKFDFQKDSDIKQLYDKAKDIKQQITNVDYNGNSSSVNRLLEVTEKLEKLPDVRIITLPNCRMATSGTAGDLKKFDEMWTRLDEKRKDKFFPRDFMTHNDENGKLTWFYAVEEWVTEIDMNGFEIIDFEEGIYAAAIARDDSYEDGMRVFNGIKKFVTDSDVFELDINKERVHLWHVIGSPITDKALGHRQVEIFVPIKLRLQ
ncbi:MAG: MerR family transcriptional regulator [Gorillibacterium sp.]|nr:MerR family transcriptional regulator [Gorillibacterium sp.]